VAFSPDGKSVAAGTKDGCVHQWCVETGEHLVRTSAEASCVVSVAFSPDGRRLAGGHLSGIVLVWDLQTWSCVARLVGEEDVDGLAFSPDGRFVASQSLRWTVRLWDVEKQECVRVVRGTADATAAATGWPAYPWWAVGQRWETRIEPSRGGPAAAWLAGTLHRLATHPSGRVWAATRANHVEVFALEGE
jgi:WD40 repeat protein